MVGMEQTYSPGAKRGILKVLNHATNGAVDQTIAEMKAQKATWLTLVARVNRRFGIHPPLAERTVKRYIDWREARDDAPWLTDSRSKKKAGAR